MLRRMKSIWSLFEFGTIKPCKCCSKKAKVEMIFNRHFISALGVECSNLVLDFFESAFDFPSCGIIFDHLFWSQFEVGSNKRECKIPIIDEYDFNFAFQCAGDADEFGETDLFLLPVNEYRRTFRLIFKLCSNFRNIIQSFTVFSFSSPFWRCVFGKTKECVINAQSGEKFYLLRKIFANFLQKPICAEPTVAYDQNGMFENLPQFDYQRSSNSRFCFKPFFMGTVLQRICLFYPAV